MYVCVCMARLYRSGHDVKCPGDGRGAKSHEETARRSVSLPLAEPVPSLPQSIKILR